MELRIGILGCSGTGKSVLAERLSLEFSVPFLPSKDVTNCILGRDGYDYGSGQQVEKFLATRERQQEILSRTRDQQWGGSFVTDRTSVDLAAYAILEMGEGEGVSRYVDFCREMVSIYTHLFFCPWHSRSLKDNNKRTLDPWYQFAVHSVQLGVVDFFGAKIYHLISEDLDGRVCEIGKVLSEGSSL